MFFEKRIAQTFQLCYNIYEVIIMDCYIPSIDAKDICIGNSYSGKGFPLRN